MLVRLARRTLEWDLAMAGNTEVMLAALADVKPVAGPTVGRAIAGKSANEQADTLLDK